MRRPLSILVAGLIALAAAGCGAQKSAQNAVQNAVDPVAQAATRTASAGSVEVTMTGKVSASGQEIPLSGTGAFDLKAKRGHFDLTTTVPGQGDLKIQELVDGLTIYLRSDVFARFLPAGKHWLKLDLQALGKKAGIDLGQLQQLGAGTDPTQFLSYLAKTADVQKVGDEDIDGTPTTHYRATIDLDKLAAASGDPKLAESVRQLQKTTGIKRIPTDVWIGKDGRVRRQSLDYTSTGATPTRVSFVIDYRNYGVPVDVQTPDAGDTLDAATLLGALGGTGG
ncbi:MAG: hypothetical protein QOC78_425 [Solirubrobacteraceae bacterium]|jgi:hypothetical protein|nr:hypothetical protein [Solirubrobacteraceae bacterium]